MFDAFTLALLFCFRALSISLTLPGFAARHAAVARLCFSGFSFLQARVLAMSVSRLGMRCALPLAESLSGLADCHARACLSDHTMQPSLIRRSAIWPCLQGFPVKFRVSPAATASGRVMFFACNHPP